MGYDKFKTKHCGAENGDGYWGLVKAMLAAWLRGELPFHGRGAVRRAAWTGCGAF